MSKIKLGAQIQYPKEYSAKCLEPISRTLSREKLDGFAIDNDLPFSGDDIWTAYELSWLDDSGKPIVAVGEFIFNCRSHSIVESKSFKYYLNSFNQTKFKSIEDVEQTMRADLSAASGCDVFIRLKRLNDTEGFRQIGVLPGRCVDDLPLNDVVYSPDKKLLKITSQTHVSDSLYSHLLKSNCPVTNQPDWATLWVKYEGPKILPESLLAYVISYREHQDFHENCVEQIFMDILSACKPKTLSVYARYTRRGGLDINPFRTNCNETAPQMRISRQ